jgi:hypothetical protein
MGLLSTDGLPEKALQELSSAVAAKREKINFLNIKQFIFLLKRLIYP